MSSSYVRSMRLKSGTLGLCPLPGRDGDFAGDFAQLRAWKPDVVVSLTETKELKPHGAEQLDNALKMAGLAQIRFPIVDFSVPTQSAEWDALSKQLHALLAQNKRVLLHCLGGVGRSGMVALRLMVEAGYDPDTSLDLLRKARPGAVETLQQLAFACAPAEKRRMAASR